MASSTASLALSHSLPKAISHQRIHNSLPIAPKQAAPPRRSANRRDCLLLLTATTALTAVSLSPAANAQDIPLFGLRRKIEKAEKEAEELVKEGIEGLESAEKGLEAAEKKAIKTAEDEIDSVAGSLGFSGLSQAGVVAGAEVLGVLVATSIVNGILGPEPKKS